MNSSPVGSAEEVAGMGAQAARKADATSGTHRAFISSALKSSVGGVVTSGFGVSVFAGLGYKIKIMLLVFEVQNKLES